MAVNPTPYIPSFLKAALEDSTPLELTYEDVRNTNISSTGSFAYDPSSYPLKNTQQLNVDWSAFENHTFFSSAETKVNVAFDQIINHYPFDGTQAEIEAFNERLTGFDKYVFDQFPRYRGQLHFSGTVQGEDTDGTLGTWIAVNDSEGSLYPLISRKRSGASILNPTDATSLSIELQLFVPEITNGIQIIAQKLRTSTEGFSLFLTASASSATTTMMFAFVSGSNAMSVGANLAKGVFNHVCAIFDRDQTRQVMKIYVDGELAGSSQKSVNIGDVDINATEFIIGSGSAIRFDGNTYTPRQTFSGSIDELRVFHSTRTQQQIRSYSSKSIYASPELKLYYRFNEPGVQLGQNPTDAVNAIVIDSSGNSLHSTISNYTNSVWYDVNGDITASSLRQNAALDSTSRMSNERTDSSIVLFPAHPDIVELNEVLLTSASLFDEANPNLITRLIPQHYLLEGQVNDGFDDVKGTIGSAFDPSTGMPGEGKVGSTQLMLTFLYTWARFFDDIKLYIDSFSLLRTVDYHTEDTAPDNFLIDIVKSYGFHLPPLFNDSTIEQYVQGENITQDVSTSEYALRYVQNQLLRRTLVSMPNILRSKGTQHSIKSFLRTVGIDPDNSLRIREYGGPTIKQLSFAREKKREPGTMVQFVTSSLAVGPYMSGSRVEVGFPYPVGTMTNTQLYPPHGISNNVSDGLFTSGSWTYEALYKYVPSVARNMAPTQSLARMMVTGSNYTSSPGLIANLVAMSSSVDPKLVLYVKTGMQLSASTLELSLPFDGPGLFDSTRWNVSFGRYRSDSISSTVSSSYFLRLSTQNDGDIITTLSTGSWFQESTGNDALTYVTASLNTSGAFVAIGKNQTISSGSSINDYYLNNLMSPSDSRITDFDGAVSGVRFWSKALSENEWKEHVRNYKSLGVEDPLKNYNFTKTPSGSFERLRLDVFNKQPIRRANATASLGPTGSISFLDHSLNGMHFSGSGFQTEEDCYFNEIFDYSYLSPYFDEASTVEKVRVRGFLDQANVDAYPWSEVSPRHEIVKSERPTDDTRLSIEFSLVDALNRDIVNMFATFNALDNALGSPELLYSPDYPDLAKMRDIYFNRLSSKLNFKEFFEFFRWFDRTVGTFIEQLVPRKTKFKGTNFTIESHMLERHKVEYRSNEQYVIEANRLRINDTLLVQQLTGIIKKI